MHRCRLFLGLFLAVIAFAGIDGAVLAQDAAAPDDAGKTSAKLASTGWTLGCKPAGSTQELVCEGSQTILVEKTRQTMLVVFVSPWKEAEKPDSFILRFQLPHGLDFPSGVTMLIDDKPASSPKIQTSSQAGVFARADLTDTLLESMKEGAEMKIEFTALNGNKLTVPATLKGFSAVYAKLK